jgi:hypothetical protein
MLSPLPANKRKPKYSTHASDEPEPEELDDEDNDEEEAKSE